MLLSLLLEESQKGILVGEEGKQDDHACKRVADCYLLGNLNRRVVGELVGLYDHWVSLLHVQLAQVA